MSKRVLIHGGDETLLETRRLILTREGLAVDTCLNGLEVAGLLSNAQPDLLIVCSSVDYDSKQRDVASAHANQPKVKCLVIDAQNSHGARSTNADETFDAFEGPSRFVTEVRKLLAL